MCPACLNTLLENELREKSERGHEKDKFLGKISVLASSVKLQLKHLKQLKYLNVVLWSF